MVFVAVVLLGVLCYGYWNTFRPVLREIEVQVLRPSDRIEESQSTDVSQSIDALHGTGALGRIDELRVLHLSDMHMERISVSPQRMYDAVADTNPDLIVLTGDYLDHINSLAKWEQYLQVIAGLEPEYGIYAVLGNHDYRLTEQGFQRLLALMETYGCRVLRNEAVSIEHQGQPINIVGVDDYHTRKSRLDSAFANIDDSASTLVITHDPNVLLEMGEQHQFDYLLAGHFHGGQCNLPFVFRLRPMGSLPKQKLYKGLLEYQGKQIYISEGLGQSALNIRFNSRPEITVHKITF